MKLDSWTTGLVHAMSALWEKIVNFIPNLLGAVVLVLLGFIVAKLLDTLISKLLAKLGLDRLMAGTGLNKLMAKVGVQSGVSELIGKVFYWFVLLVFLVAAAESLGLERISTTLDVLALYIPKIFASMLVLVFGVLLAQLLSGMVRGAAEGVGLEYAAGLGRVVQGLVIIVSISVAIGQLDIKTELLNYVIAIILLTVGLGIALALGLSSKEIAKQIIAGIYVRELYEVGEWIEINQVEGEIEQIGTVKTVLITEQGQRISLSNQLLLEQQVKSR
ncbi:transporter [Thiopseudomonas alkaliphila]|uniref:mechanosensitive ion channel family protein n=1 Tax=Thiopseudomonas alkaliphila TaxID=1697053 RepID=UPI00069FE4E8|nr:mechanosensitive ion channel domain-containing protein [Thiopseudomonas alkaliphila]AKX43834.1 transporter [Thiopseudomonas alkaliphila]AKX46090.1 transporter [Thiopseudomonas alkaliphila]MDM1717134.1 mechanosensitive ion channel family protein [Thiopseudomonas alkaliphila]